MDNRNKDLSKIIEEGKNVPDDISLDEKENKEKEEMLEEDNPEPIEEPTPQEPDIEEDGDVDGVAKEEPVLDEPDEEPAEKPEPHKPSREELEKQYSDSSREAMSLYFRNRKLTDAISKASDMPDPTEDELRDYVSRMGEDYDNLDEFTKNLITDNMKANRFQKQIINAAVEDRKLDAWVEKIDSFLEDEKMLNKYPSLHNNGAEFKKFASKETRRGSDLEDLLGAFLYKRAGMEQPKKKGEMLLSKGAGKSAPTKSRGTSEEDLAQIRKTQGEKAYKEALKKYKPTV